jgi:tetratricopeptide (TPR) repeat protein
MLGAGFLASCDRARATAVRRLNEGLKAYQQGKTVEAVEKMQKAAEADGEFAKPHYQMGQIYEMDLSEPDKAIQHYREALDRKPDHAKYAYKLGRVLASEGDHEEAIAKFEQATQSDENHSRAWFRSGLSQRAMGDHADAVDSFATAIESSPRVPTEGVELKGPTADHYYHELADLYVEFGFFDKALQVYENGIQNIPESGRLYQGRGVAQLELERYLREDARIRLHTGDGAVQLGGGAPKDEPTEGGDESARSVFAGGGASEQSGADRRRTGDPAGARQRDEIRKIGGRTVRPSGYRRSRRSCRPRLDNSMHG